MGSARDRAAKATLPLGVRAVLADSFERIHRSNLVGIGSLPLRFELDQSAESLGSMGVSASPLRSTTASSHFRKSM